MSPAPSTSSTTSTSAGASPTVVRSPLDKPIHPLAMRLMRKALSGKVRMIERGELDKLEREREKFLATRLKGEPAFVKALIGVLEMRAPKVHIREHLATRPDGSSMRIRVFTPKGTSSRPRPAFVFFHGGGFYGGTVDGNDAHCSQIAHHADVVVLSVDYRLAPENPFPAGVEDCMLGLRWTITNAASLGIDPDWIGSGGQSAGGNLAAVVGLLARDEGVTLRTLVLEVPVLDLTQPMPIYPQMAEFEPFFRSEHLNMNVLYADGHDLAQPRISPGLAPDLTGLPPTHVIACDGDPLADQERDYVERLREAGVAATLLVFPGLTHGTSGLTRFMATARDFQAAVISAVRSELVAMRPAADRARP